MIQLAVSAGNEADEKRYYPHNLMEEQQVRELFERCGKSEVTILLPGWKHLIDRFGFTRLHRIDQDSNWLESASVDDFVYKVRSMMHELSEKEKGRQKPSEEKETD